MNELEEQPCFWKQESFECADSFIGDCGAEWQITEGIPSENGMNFCPKCGRKLVEILLSEEEE
jgi:hypothetical protein